MITRLIKSLLYGMLAILFLNSCSGKKSEEPQIKVPAGMSIRSVFTSRMDANSQPTDEISYIPPTMSEVTIYSTFEGISTTPHVYQIIIANEKGEHACPQDPPYEFTPGGSSENIWTKIAVDKCLSTPGEYTIKIYLDGNWVLAKKLKVLSQEDIKSGTYEAYWNKDKYLEVYPIPKVRTKGDWLVHSLGGFPNRLSKLFVVPHKQLNRIFVMEEANGEYAIKEFTHYGLQELFIFPNGDQDLPWFTQYKVQGDLLYVFNSKIKYSIDLSSGNINPHAQLPFIVAPDNSYISPDGKYVLSRAGFVNGKSILQSGTCPGGIDVGWVSWAANNQQAYCMIQCKNKETLSGLYLINVVTQQSQRLMEEFECMTSPSYFNNNGCDFIAFFEKEEGEPTKIKIATEYQFYKESGFDLNYYWNGNFSLPASENKSDNSYWHVNYLNEPSEYLAYSFSDEYGMSSREGVIILLGTLQDGPFAGKEIYSIRDDEYWDDSKEGDKIPYSPIENYFLIRNGEELVMLNLPENTDESFSFRDLDRKRKKSPLFDGATKIINYKNQLIAGLLSSSVIDIPNTSVKLKREGIVRNLDEKKSYRKIFDHELEGEFFVKQNDDGSFWLFNEDNTATLYHYQFDFDVSVNSTKLNMNEYVPYTNNNCQGNALDFAHIISLDPSRLKEIGKTSTDEPVFGFTSDQDKILQQEYSLLKQAYDDAGLTFKSLKQFIENVPLFLWKDPFGRYVRFIRREYLAPANC